MIIHIDFALEASCQQSLRVGWRNVLALGLTLNFYDTVSGQRALGLMLHGGGGAKDQKLQHVWHLGSDGVKTLAILIFSRTPRQWRRMSLCLRRLMSNALWDILSYPNQVPLIPLWVHWFLSTHQHRLRLKGWTRVCMCVLARGIKRTATTWCAFSFLAHLRFHWPHDWSSQHRWRLRSRRRCAHHASKLKFIETCAATITLWQCCLWSTAERGAAANTAAQPWSAWPILHLWVLRSEFFLIMDWHKRRGFSWVTDWGGAGTHSHFS